MNKLDKKQIPQFAALCVLSAGVFGYFVVKIVTPSPAAAGTRPRPASEVLQVSAASPASAKQAETSKVETGKAGTASDAVPAGEEAEAPAPTPGMRDPFVIGYIDPATQPALPAAPKPAQAAATLKSAASVKAIGPQVATIREVAPASADAPSAPALPLGIKGFPPLSAAPTSAPKKALPPAPPAWTVTGVLQGEAGQMAVLRSGEARRIVCTGDFVDSLYRVVAVTRSAVVLRHGATFYHLTLGATQPAATAPILPSLPHAAVAAPAPTPAVAPQADALAPASPPVSLEAGLTRMIQGALLMARSYMTPAQAQTDICFASFRVPTQEDAQASSDSAPLDLGRDVYGGGARWRCVTTAPELDTAAEAGTLPCRFI